MLLPRAPLRLPCGAKWESTSGYFPAPLTVSELGREKSRAACLLTLWPRPREPRKLSCARARSPAPAKPLVLRPFIINFLPYHPSGGLSAPRPAVSRRATRAVACLFRPEEGGLLASGSSSRAARTGGAGGRISSSRRRWRQSRSSSSHRSGSRLVSFPPGSGRFSRRLSPACRRWGAELLAILLLARPRVRFPGWLYGSVQWRRQGQCRAGRRDEKTGESARRRKRRRRTGRREPARRERNSPSTLRAGPPSPVPSRCSWPASFLRGALCA